MDHFHEALKVRWFFKQTKSSVASVPHYLLSVLDLRPIFSRTDPAVSEATPLLMVAAWDRSLLATMLPATSDIVPTRPELTPDFVTCTRSVRHEVP